MELKNRSGYIGSNLAADGVVNSLSLILAVSDKDDLAGVHDTLHAERNSVLRNSHGVAAEETGVSLSRFDGDLLLMSERIDSSAGLVEADVTVAADSEKLKIDAAGSDDLGIIGCGLVVGEIGTVAGKIGVCNVNVDMIEKVVVHEITV